MTAALDAGARGGRAAPGDALRAGLRVLGELLITAGAVVLLFAAYLLWGTNLKTAAAQDDLRAELRREWAAAPSPVYN